MSFVFGIMQGRLLPKYKQRFQAHPLNSWKKEFELASNFGFKSIEFILDYEDFGLNPLMTKKGINDIRQISNQNEVFVKSICADFFMESPIFLDDKESFLKNLDVLQTLTENAADIGVTDIVIPMVDNSSILKSKNKMDQSIYFFTQFLKNFKKNINICLETDLPPKQFLNFVQSLNDERVKINYDIGNSASLGYDFIEEFNVYSNLITDIHIKDRLYQGPSVPLGEGNAKLFNFFNYLIKINYQGLLIFQAFRTDDGPGSLLPQLKYVEKLIDDLETKDLENEI